MAKALPVSLV
ncbi:hypothetical protein Ga0076813_103313, partial [endosymbiont of Ridgeia piscesae]